MTSGEPSFVQRQRRRATEASNRAVGWVGIRRRDEGVVDFAATLYERDRDTFASVLGSAIAFRLFLFIVPATIAVVGLLNALNADWIVTRLLEASATTGNMAKSIDDAAHTTQKTGIGLFLTGVFLTLLASRSLTRVLGACAAGAWRLPAQLAKASMRASGALCGVLLTLIAIATILGRVHDVGGIALTTASIICTIALFGFGWFVLTLFLPRATSDPGALLPGAAFVGIGFAAIQWFMQFYLPGRLERANDMMGNLAITVVSLGYLFFVGRLMAASLVLNAVIWQRLGSISGLVFGLPVLRRLPVRYPKLGKFFDLDAERNDRGVESEP